MSADWTARPAPQLAQPDIRHEAVIDGLKATIEERPGVSGGYAGAMLRGWLADISIHAFVGDGYDTTVEEAKARAVVAAHRLYAAGVRGFKGYPVGCCRQLFTTRDAADQHEVDHQATGRLARASEEEG